MSAEFPTIFYPLEAVLTNAFPLSHTLCRKSPATEMEMPPRATGITSSLMGITVSIFCVQHS